MVLALPELTAYLLDRRFMHPDAVLDGRLSLADTSRRNHNVLVSAEPGVGLFVKQGGASLAHEAAVYRLFGALRRAGVIAAAVPRDVGFDPERGILVLESVPGALDLTAYHTGSGRFPATVGNRLGSALADLHVSATIEARVRQAEFTGRMPWALALDRPGLGFYREMSNGGVELVRMLQSSPRLRAALAELRAEWRSDTFLHHDLKWDNCLMVPAGVSGRRTRLMLVDWEFGDLGDAAWDTGSAFGAYLGCWLGSIPVTGGEEPGRYLDLAAFPLARMRAAMAAFWRSYVAGRGWDAATADAELVRAVRYSGCGCSRRPTNAPSARPGCRRPWSAWPSSPRT